MMQQKRNSRKSQSLGLPSKLVDRASLQELKHQKVMEDLVDFFDYYWKVLHRTFVIEVVFINPLFNPSAASVGCSTFSLRVFSEPKSLFEPISV